LFYSKKAILQKSHSPCGNIGGIVNLMDRALGARGTMRKLTQSKVGTMSYSDSWNLAQTGESHTQKNLMMEWWK
jgi:hypothetical protein